MVWEQYGWIIPGIGYNLVAIPMALGKFPPAWFPAPNIRGKEEFCPVRAQARLMHHHARDPRSTTTGILPLLLQPEGLYGVIS